MFFDILIPLIVIAPVIILIIYFFAFLVNRKFKATKKRSVGITAYGIFLVLFALYLTGGIYRSVKVDIGCLTSDKVMVSMAGSDSFYEFVPRTKDNEKVIMDKIPFMILDYLLWLGIVFILIILAIGIFKLKNWARLMSLWGSILLSVWFIVCGSGSFYYPLNLHGADLLLFWIYAVIIIVPAVIFLTRAKVKGQFK